MELNYAEVRFLSEALINQKSNIYLLYASSHEFSINWSSLLHEFIINCVVCAAIRMSSNLPVPWETRRCGRLSGWSRVLWERCSRRGAARTVPWWGCSTRRRRRTSHRDRFDSRGSRANMSLRWGLTKSPPMLNCKKNLRSLWPRMTIIKSPLFPPSWVSFCCYFLGPNCLW